MREAPHDLSSSVYASIDMPFGLLYHQASSRAPRYGLSYMSTNDIPILVVDDAKFSSAIIAKALRNGGFGNVRFTNNPLQALRSLEKRPASIVIADWLMPSLDGTELARRIRKLDETQDRYTYIMLLTARDDFSAMQSAFDDGVDDFMNKANLRGQLLPRIIAAARITARHNELMQANRTLGRKIRDLQTTDLVDSVTGLGNMRFTLEQLDALVRDVDARGGAACLLLVGINNLDVISEQYDEVAVNELISGIAAKVRQLVRPLDLVTRPEPNLFAVVMRQDSIDNCTSTSFRRIFDNLYMHSFRTSEGFIPIVVGVSICAVDSSTGFPAGKLYFSAAYDALRQSFDTGLITVEQYAPKLG